MLTRHSASKDTCSQRGCFKQLKPSYTLKGMSGGTILPYIVEVKPDLRLLLYKGKKIVRLCKIVIFSLFLDFSVSLKLQFKRCCDEALNTVF